MFQQRTIIEINKNKVEKFLLPTQKKQLDTVHEYLHRCSFDDHFASSNAFIHFLGLVSHENAAQIIDHKMQKQTLSFKVPFKSFIEG